MSCLLIMNSIDTVPSSISYVPFHFALNHLTFRFNLRQGQLLATNLIIFIEMSVCMGMHVLCSKLHQLFAVRVTQFTNVYVWYKSITAAWFYAKSIFFFFILFFDSFRFKFGLLQIYNLIQIGTRIVTVFFFWPKICVGNYNRNEIETVSYYGLLRSLSVKIATNRINDN